MLGSLHAGLQHQKSRESVSSTADTAVATSEESEWEDEAGEFKTFERQRSQSLPTKRGRGRPRRDRATSSNPVLTPVGNSKRKADQISPAAGYSLKKWCESGGKERLSKPSEERGGKSQRDGKGGEEKMGDKKDVPESMSLGDMNSEMLKKMDILIEEIRKGRETQERQYRELTEKWKGLDDRANRMDSAMEEMRKARKDDKIEVAESTRKAEEDRLKLAGRIAILEEGMARLGEAGDKSGGRLGNGEEDDGTRKTLAMRRFPEEGTPEKRKWEEWERERIRNNIVISGLQLPGKLGREELGEWLDSKLGARVKLRRVWMLRGKKTKIVAECENREDKEQIMSKKPLLKGTEVFIDSDTTFKERGNKWKLRNYAKEAKEKGAKVKFGYNRVHIDGVEHRYDEWADRFFLHKNPEPMVT